MNLAWGQFPRPPTSMTTVVAGKNFLSSAAWGVCLSPPPQVFPPTDLVKPEILALQHPILTPPRFFGSVPKFFFQSFRAFLAPTVVGKKGNPAIAGVWPTNPLPSFGPWSCSGFRPGTQKISFFLQLAFVGDRRSLQRLSGA